jgi:hypothetical protein
MKRSVLAALATAGVSACGGAIDAEVPSGLNTVSLELTAGMPFTAQIVAVDPTDGKLTVEGQLVQLVQDAATRYLATTEATGGGIALTWNLVVTLHRGCDLLFRPGATPPTDVCHSAARAGFREIQRQMATSGRYAVITTTPDLRVATFEPTIAPAPAPAQPYVRDLQLVASADAFVTNEDAALFMNVLANDLTGGDTPAVTIVTPPKKGTVTVNGDGTITYVPFPDANGTDELLYRFTVGAGSSNDGHVAVVISPVNNAPVAVADLAFAVAGTSQAMNVLSNDQDADGAADLTNAILVTPPAAGATVTGGAGGTFSFLASSPGTYTFTYRAQDTSGASSTEATVTVQAAAAEIVAIARASYQTSRSRLRVEGGINPSANQTITVESINSAGTVLGLFGTATPVNGEWEVDRIVALPTGTTAVKASTSNGSVATRPLRLQ